MFSHIPNDVFTTQINGNMDEALKVLKVRTESLKHKTRIFEWEFASLDPENPITQVSKTPSDEFPGEWNDEEPEDEKEIHRQSNEMPRIQKQDSKGKLDMVDENEEKEVVAENEAQEDDDNVENEGEMEKVNENEEEGSSSQAEKKEGKPANLELKSGDELNPVEDKDKIPIKWIRAKRPASIMKTKLLVKDVVKFIEEMKKKITQEDLNLRVWPNLASCRFELPIDLTRLEDLTPLKYVSQYCRVTESRRAVYAAKYERYLPQKEAKSLITSDLRNVYENIYQESVLADEMLHLRRLLNLDLNEELEMELFTAVSCLMERVIVKSKGLGFSQENKKNVFEETDFCSLNGKLHGVEISRSLRNLLEFIRNT